MLTREDMLVQSVEDYLRANLFTDRDLPDAEVKLADAFDYKMFGSEPLDKEYVVLGFNFDDGGKRGEMGSDLMVRIHNLEVWVFATTPKRGENLAYQVKAAWEMDNFRVPFKDFRAEDSPVIDYLVVADDPGPRVARQPHPDPAPWQQNAWTITARVTDEYYASAW